MALTDIDVEFIEENKQEIDGDRHSLLFAIALMDYALYAGISGILKPRGYIDWHLSPSLCDGDIKFSAN